MQSAELPDGDISGAVMLYNRPEALSVEAHGRLGFRRMEKPFGFAAGAHMIPLTVTEFGPASMHYPIIFVGEERQPVAMMGLRTGENLFISPEGEAAPETYIPAYIRRYPFVFAHDEASQRMILCIDRGAEALVEDGGDSPLFDGPDPSEFTQGAMNFCRDFEAERQRTDDFIKLLKEADLFEIKQAVFTPRGPDGAEGKPQIVAEYFSVSEEKLNKLPAERLYELQQNGALMQIYAHMISLMGWDRLVMRAMRLKGELGTAAAGNA